MLSVAGTDPAGKIHGHSNWGPKLAQVAAPFCVSTVKPLAPASSEPELVTECGTSFSAPVIGNQALKMFVQNPQLTAPEVAQSLIISNPAPL